MTMTASWQRVAGRKRDPEKKRGPRKAKTTSDERTGGTKTDEKMY